MVAEGGKHRDQQLRCVRIRAILDPSGRGGNTHVEGHRLCSVSSRSLSPQRLTWPRFMGQAEPRVVCVPRGCHAPGDRGPSPSLHALLCPPGLTFSPSQARNMPVWLPSQDEPLPSSNCAIRVGDKGWWSVQASQFIARTLLSSPLTLGRLAEDGMPRSSGSVFQAPPLLGSGPPTHPSYSVVPLPACSGPSLHCSRCPLPPGVGRRSSPPPHSSASLPLQSPMTSAGRTTRC